MLETTLQIQMTGKKKTYFVSGSNQKNVKIQAKQENLCI